MSAILDQLGLDASFFSQFIIFMVIFFILSPLYFKPFLKLFEARHKKTVEDRAAAEKILAEANAKFEEYKKNLATERAESRKEYDAMILEARHEETQILSEARNQAKKITQEALESITQQHDDLKKKLEVDVESLAQGISQKLLSGGAGK